jgi:beta-galactosidase
MKKVDFNHCWQYKHLNKEEPFQDIVLPHDAMIYEPRHQSNPSSRHGAYFAGEDYEYIKEFFIEEKEKGNLVIFEFEGVYQHYEVFINDQKVGECAYGYSNFYIDATSAIRFGEHNRIRVIAYNAKQPNSRWYSGAGIYRPVLMYLLPLKHILLDGIKIKTIDTNKPIIEVNVLTSTSGKLQISIEDGSHSLAHYETHTNGITKQIIVLPNAILWSLDQPKLYHCKVIFEGDEHVVSFGIRKITCDATNGFCINGERVILLGSCIHHDHGLLGAMNHPFADERRILLLKEAGFNCIRSAHNPFSKASLEACDKYGMLVIDEYADMWYIHKTQYDYANQLISFYEKDLTLMVNKDYNHPSVIMYSLGNEVTESSEKRGWDLMKKMKNVINSIDDTRPVTCGINLIFNLLNALGFGIYSDKKVQKGQKVGSEFFNDLTGRLGGKIMKLGARLPGVNKQTKKAYAICDVAGYNYGIFRYKHDIKHYPKRVILGSETFCSDAFAFYRLAKKKPALIGDCVWAGQDYLGEVAIGSQEYRDYAKDFRPVSGWISAGSGRIDLTGKQLSVMAYMRVAYEIDQIRMAVIPVPFYRQPHSPSAWKMTPAIESWTFHGYEGKKTKVEVYAQGHYVELILNNKIIAKKRVNKNGCCYFVIEYEPGELKAINYSKDKKMIASTTLVTGGKETTLLSLPEKYSIKQNELAYVRFQYVDPNGTINPLARGKISLDVEGGTLLAFGHACPYNEDGYHLTSSDTYYGEALAIIRPSDKNIIKIKATSAFGSTSSSIKVH